MDNRKVFTEIMNVIEKKTDLPLMASAIDEWLENETNRNIYAIYQLASISRK